MNKTVSIIVPAYNVEKTIERCMDGLLKQTYGPTEILIIDDGSTDSTGELLDSYKDFYDHIKVIHQTNTGVSAARNRGLDEVSSECIVFVDSDDAVGEHYLETLMKYSEFDFVTCGFHMQNSKFEWKKMAFDGETQQMNRIREHPSKYMGKYYFGSPWAKLYKSEIIQRSDLRFVTDMFSGEDILFNFQYMLLAETIRIEPLCDYYYYYQESSLSHSKHLDAWKWEVRWEKVIKEFFDCYSVDEVRFKRQREFGVLKQLLENNAKSMSAEQIESVYKEPVFQDCIQFKKKNGTAEERFLIFTLKNSIYRIYELFLMMKKIIRRGTNYFKKKMRFF